MNKSIKMTENGDGDILSLNAVLVYPYPGDKIARLNAGKIFTTIHNEGMALKAVLPSGKSETFEMLQIIIQSHPAFQHRRHDRKKVNGYTLSSLGDFRSAAKRLAGLKHRTETQRVDFEVIRS